MTLRPTAKTKSHFEITIHREAQFAELVFNGAVDSAVLNNAFVRLVEHPQFRQNLNALYDYSDAHPDVEMQEIEEYAQFVASLSQRRGANYKLALVADDTLNTALLNVYKLLIAKTTVDAEVFSQRSRAMGWLSSDE